MKVFRQTETSMDMKRLHNYFVGEFFKQDELPASETLDAFESSKNVYYATDEYDNLNGVVTLRHEGGNYKPNTTSKEVLYMNITVSNHSFFEIFTNILKLIEEDYKENGACLIILCSGGEIGKVLETTFGFELFCDDNVYGYYYLEI